MKLKKLLSLMLVGSLALGMTACGGGDSSSSAPESESSAAPEESSEVHS